MHKEQIRQQVWDELERTGTARFPFPPHGRIPNFDGAENSADRLAEHTAWREAETIKSNPDSPQRPVRRRALEHGKTVYMAVPRLRDEKCFLRLDPAEIDDYDHATTIRGSSEVGEQVGPGEIHGIELIVSGSVAVNRYGVRVGKGEGYSDLEFAVLREVGLVDDETRTATTVHELQVLDVDIPTTAHDVPIDLIVTPDRIVRDERREKPSGIQWEALSAERIDDIPILRRLQRG